MNVSQIAAEFADEADSTEVMVRAGDSIFLVQSVTAEQDDDSERVVWIEVEEM